MNLTRILKHSVALIVAVFIVAIIVSPVLADQGGAQNAITSAKQSISTCYAQAKQAESAGANVSSLMVTLNDAAGSLSKAELAYASNDYDSAYTYATQCQNKLGDFTSQVDALTANAQSTVNQNSLTTILLLVTSVGVLCAGVGAWFVLGRQERRSLNGSTKV